MTRLIVAVLIVWCALLVANAFGHEGSDSLSAWYRSLETPAGASCCNMQDCSPVDARLSAGHWQVLIDNQWREVPDRAVLSRENEAGEAVACIWPPGEIRCFVPPSET